MFGFLFKKEPKINRLKITQTQFEKIKSLYAKNEISFERKEELSSLIEKYGYLPYSQARALKELKPEEVFFCLQEKLKINGMIENN